MLADVFDRRVAVLASQEGSAHGAALLAMVGTGAFGSVVEACGAAVVETESLAPDPEIAAVYRAGHSVFAALYPALRFMNRR
jgi:xylulokinase